MGTQKKRHVRWPRAGGFCYQAREFFAYNGGEVFWGIQITLRKTVINPADNFFRTS